MESLTYEGKERLKLERREKRNEEIRINYTRTEDRLGKERNGSGTCGKKKENTWK